MRNNHSRARSLVLAMSIAGTCVFGGALPSVTDVALKQASQKRVEISYALSDEAIVTLHGMGSVILVR